MIEVYFDGACEPRNPGGTGTYGYAVYRNGQIIKTGYGCVGRGEGISNNLAEYSGLCAALRWLKTQGLEHEDILIKGDSMLVIQQMLGSWKIKNGAYVEKAYETQELLGEFQYSDLEWIPREENDVCDRLSKIALKERGVKVMTH